MIDYSASLNKRRKTILSMINNNRFSAIYSLYLFSMPLCMLKNDLKVLGFTDIYKILNGNPQTPQDYSEEKIKKSCDIIGIPPSNRDIFKELLKKWDYEKEISLLEIIPEKGVRYSLNIRKRKDFNEILEFINSKPKTVNREIISQYLGISVSTVMRLNTNGEKPNKQEKIRIRREKIRKLYEDTEMTKAEIAQKLKISLRTVFYDLEEMSKEEPLRRKADFQQINVVIIARMYERGETVEFIAELLGGSVEIVNRHLEEARRQGLL